MSSNSDRDQQERRTAGIQQSGRAARVVASVLKATGEELNRVGFAALRVEDVAERAGVNKTTIYRRWPTKSELVAETVRGFKDTRTTPDTGTLRGDLRTYLLNLVKRSKNPMWRGVLIALTNRTDPVIESLAKELRNEERQLRTELVQRGIDRGELPKAADAGLIGDLVSAPILRRLLTFGENVETAYIDAVLDVVLAGAAATAARDPKK